MKEQYINALKAATIRFLGGPEIGVDRLQQSNYINQLEDVLHADFSLTWENIDAIENSVMH